jgi:hypothetical protein
VALGKIGPAARPAVPALLEVLRDPRQGLGRLPEIVADAIARIDPEAAAKIKDR